MTKAAVMRMALKMQRLKLKGRLLKLEALTTAPGTEDYLAPRPASTQLFSCHSPFTDIISMSPLAVWSYTKQVNDYREKSGEENEKK